MKKVAMLSGCLMAVLALALPAVAAEIPSEVTLFKNVNVFDGKNEKLLKGYDVLVVGNKIKKIEKDIKIANTYEIDAKTGGLKPVEKGGHTCDFDITGSHAVMVYEPEKQVKKEVTVNVIDGKGRTLMPGLIDMHWHMTMAECPQSALLTGDILEVAIRGALASGPVLMRGFTTVRNLGGNALSIKKLIDSGVLVGPRIFPSGPCLSQTGGHFDYRLPNEVTDDTAINNYWAHQGLIESPLMNPNVWEALKRALQTKLLDIEDVSEEPAPGVTSLRPEPIPLEVKVILLGSYEIFEMLQTYDSRFNKIFKVRADFDQEVRRTLETEMEINPRLLVFGEDVGVKGGVHGATLNMHTRFGEDRVFDTSLNEDGIVGCRRHGLGWLAASPRNPVPQICRSRA